MPVYNSVKDIKKNKLFIGLTETALESFFDPKEIKAIQEGELVYKSGEQSDAIYLVIRGEVRLKFSANNYVSNRIYNDFFGEKEVIEETKRISSALAYSRLVFYRLDINILNSLTLKYPIIEENLKKYGLLKIPEVSADIERKVSIFDRDKPTPFKLFPSKNDKEESKKKEVEKPSVITKQILPDFNSIDNVIGEEDILIDDDDEGTEEIPELEEALAERNELIEPVIENHEVPIESSEEKIESFEENTGEEIKLEESHSEEESIDVQPEETNETFELLEQVEPDNTIEKIKPLKPSEPIKPVEPVKPLESVEPVKTTETVESGINREIVRKIYLCLNRIYSGISISELINNTRRAIKDLINAESVELILVDEKESSLQKLIIKEGKTLKEFFKISDGLTGNCASEKKIINYDRPTEDNRFNSKLDQPGNATLKRILYFPVINDAGETVAVIQSAREHKRYTEEEISYLTMISKQLDTAISRTTTLEQILIEEKLSVSKKLREMITKEINGPIEIIDSYTKVMSQKKLPSDTDDIIRMLQKQAASVVEITDTIFKIFSGDEFLGTSDIHFNEFIDDVLELLSEYCETRDTKLFKKIGDGAVVKIDRAKLYTAIFQIIKSSVEDTKKNGKIYFSTELTDDNIVITIQNEGKGALEYPEGDILDYIFRKEKFKEENDGLLLAKKVINAHSGDVTIESIKGVGCTFRITLPVSKT
jgi:signal transduction histidine kinase